jgi:hypothetical protein
LPPFPACFLLQKYLAMQAYHNSKKCRQQKGSEYSPPFSRLWKLLDFHLNVFAIKHGPVCQIEIGLEERQ